MSRQQWGTHHVVLNARKLESLSPAPGQERTEYWDASLAGFGVRVARSGRKTFTVRYSLHGTQRRKDLGLYAVTLGLADARQEAARIITEAKNGRDPELSAVILERAGIDDFAGLCEHFVEERLPQLRETTRKELGRVIAKELIPAWGRRDPNSIQPEEIDAWARALARRAPYVANRSFEYMRLIYNYAARRRLIRYTPFIGLEKPHPEEVRTRTFTDDEIRRIFGALVEESRQMAGLWLLLFLTGNRLRETLKAEWSWLHEADTCLLLPKTATKSKREHLVPLVPEALDVLHVLRALAGDSRYIFPGPKGAPMHWAQKSAERVWARAAIEDGRLHDIRRTVSTGLAKLGIVESIIERALNHTQPGQKLARTYNTYQYIPEKRAALTMWAQHLRAVVGDAAIASVLQAERYGYQGKGVSRRLGRSETWSQRKARLAAAGRDLVEEHREHQRLSRKLAAAAADTAATSAGVVSTAASGPQTRA